MTANAIETMSMNSFMSNFVMTSKKLTDDGPKTKSKLFQSIGSRLMLILITTTAYQYRLTDKSKYSTPRSFQASPTTSMTINQTGKVLSYC